MCGIVAYIGKKSAVPVLLEGLKKLEYRGYDSAGLCLLDKGQLITIKRLGKIAELEALVTPRGFSSGIGIGHTRWATHGAPSTANAHPHLCCRQSIAIVHNGIIENYHSLKKMLTSEGHVFRSDTDSEVLAHLIEKFHTGDLEKAVALALQNVEGTYGLAVMERHTPGIVVARRGSPLIIGLGKAENFIASDAVAVLPYTNKVIYLQDNEIACITADKYEIRNLWGEAQVSQVEEIRGNIAQIEKGGYKHFMLKEIHEQPAAVQNTLRGRLHPQGIKLSLNVQPTQFQRIVITACGTSWHAALIGKYLIEKYAAIPVEVDYASEFRYRSPIINSHTLLVVISQSGETADTLAALRKGRESGAKTLGLINVVGSTIAREVDSGIYLHAGPEIGVASTKAFVCQVTALLLLSLYFRQLSGGHIPAGLLSDLERVPEQIESILRQQEKVEEISRAYFRKRNFLYLGRGINFPVALEGALKLKEISYIHAEGYPAAEMKHGPIALIDNRMPVIFIATKGKTFDKVISNMQEVRARQGIIVTVTDHANPALQTLSRHQLIIPATNENLSPLLNVIPLQLLAYFIADQKGLDVDQPRNLAKSVTVE